jgi:uncharacterized protein YcbX
MHERQISEIWIYPIKSLGGIRLKSSRVSPKGLYLDRRWMLVDENNQFLTQRVHPKMALFKVNLNSDHLEIWYGSDRLRVPIALSLGNPIRATIWDDTVTVNEMGPEYATWFSEHLGFPCKLVSFPEENLRPVDPRFRLSDQNHVSLADAYPLLIIGESSLNDLNKRLAQEVPMNRFRPNLVFTGGQAYEEDRWQMFKVGNIRMAGVKPCARCVLTTVDQESATKGTEPLATLSSYRKVENKVLFGQNVIPIDFNDIQEGDIITLNDER